MTNSLTITREWFALLDALPDDSFRRVMRAVASFAFDGTKPEGMSNAEKRIFVIMKKAIQTRKRVARYYSKNKENRKNLTLESYASESELKRKNLTLESYALTEQELPLNIKEINGNLKKDITIDSSKDLKENRVKESPKQKRKIFVPPTLEQVREYAFERNSPADPEEFYSYHSANGWMIGRAKMVDWKKAFVYWERKEFNRARRRNSPPPRDYSGI